MPDGASGPAILVVEDEAAVRTLIVRALGSLGGTVETAATGDEARARLASGSADVVLLDLMLPGVSGLDLLAEAQAQDPDRMVVVLTGRADEPSIVEAMRRGAMEYLIKPFEVDDLVAVVARAAARTRANRDARRRAVEGPPPLEGLLVGRSGPMVELLKTVGRLAGSTVPVLVTGETGSGKELVARALHLYGPTPGGPFLAVDCASLPPSLLESELFGYERGAFTGAVAAKPGKFEAADGGTLFLDEIGNVAVETQAKLLRALEERTTQRLGSTRSVAWSARLVSATNADLKALAKEGRFREDLYFRVAGAEIRLPPLRERLDDLPALAAHFLAAVDPGRPARTLSGPALAALRAYAWPGNVRELQHALARAAAMSRSTVIEAEDLPADIRGGGPLEALGIPPAAGPAGLLTMDELRRRYARHALDACGGNKSEAARRLGLDRSTLNSLLKDES